MKKTQIYLVFLGMLILLPGIVKSQDITTADPVHVKVLADTSQVRMFLVTLHPGEQTPPHTHMLRMYYCLSGGQISRTTNGKTSLIHFTTGESGLWKPAPLTHVDKNVGNTDIKLLIVNIGSETP